MADPATMGALSIGSAVGSSILGAVGAGQSASASAKSYRYKAQIALLNKQLNEQNARWATDAGEIKALESGLKSRQDIANTKVAQSASGLDINSGSSEAVRDTQSETAQFDQNVIRWDAAKTSYGYMAKAKADEMESDLDTRAASNAERTGDIGILSSFISGAGTVASRWRQGQTLGMFESTA